MKRLNLLSLLTLFLFLFASCAQDNDFLMQDNEVGVEHNLIEKEGLTLKQKLTNIQKNGEHVLTRSLHADNSQLYLKEYKNIGTITSEKELDQLKSIILSDESYLPYYNIEDGSISLLTWSEIESRKENGNIQYSKLELNTFLNTTLKVGMNTMELIWECDSKIYKTICVTSDENIVYDNVIMNVLCISKESRLNEGLLPTMKSRNSESNVSGSYTRTLTWNAYWLWGTKRGSVEINHTIHVNEGKLTTSTCSENSYISLGSAGAMSQIKECKKGVGGYSKCNYAYYLATPTMSISVSGGNGSDFSVSVSGIGSEISGSGNDYLSSSNI